MAAWQGNRRSQRGKQRSVWGSWSASSSAGKKPTRSSRAPACQRANGDSRLGKSTPCSGRGRRARTDAASNPVSRPRSRPRRATCSESKERLGAAAPAKGSRGRGCCGRASLRAEREAPRPASPVPAGRRGRDRRGSGRVQGPLGPLRIRVHHGGAPGPRGPGGGVGRARGGRCGTGVGGRHAGHRDLVRRPPVWQMVAAVPAEGQRGGEGGGTRRPYGKCVPTTRTVRLRIAASTNAGQGVRGHGRGVGSRRPLLHPAVPGSPRRVRGQAVWGAKTRSRPDQGGGGDRQGSADLGRVGGRWPVAVRGRPRLLSIATACIRIGTMLGEARLLRSGAIGATGRNAWAARDFPRGRERRGARDGPWAALVALQQKRRGRVLLAGSAENP